MEFKSGYLPEPLEEKHWRNTLVADKLKSSVNFDSLDLGTVDMRPFTSPRHNQKSLGSCVAQATVKALEIKRIMKYGREKHVDLSVMAVYYLSRELMRPPMVMEDSGTHISKAMDVLRKFGVCEESRFPYNVDEYKSKPSWRAMRRAYINRIQSFYRIVEKGNARLEGILLHLHAGNPVVFGTAVSKNFLKHRGDGIVWPATGTIAGRHAMTILGWLPDYKGQGAFVIENSWSPTWGDDGFFYAAPEFLLNNEVQDIWAMAGGWEDWL